MLLGGASRAETVEARVLLHSGVAGLCDREKNPALAIEYRPAVSYATLRPWLGLGWATDGAVFAGVGVAREWELSSRWEASMGFGPGYYERHEGTDLGSHLEFYSYVELGYRLRPERRLIFRLAHISNGSISDRNPGTELFTVGYAFSLP